MDKIDEIETYRELITENVEYDFLIERYGSERMDELVDLMLETVLSKRDNIRIAEDDFSREVVKSHMLKINSSHIEYVFDCIDTLCLFALFTLSLPMILTKRLFLIWRRHASHPTRWTETAVRDEVRGRASKHRSGREGN